MDKFKRITDADDDAQGANLMGTKTPTADDLNGLLLAAAAGVTLTRGRVARAHCVECREEVWVWSDPEGHQVVMGLHRWANGDPWIGLHRCGDGTTGLDWPETPLIGG